jgi:ferrous iron transport protein B
MINQNIMCFNSPNTGKTSVFNQLTGLNQQVGNYPGITVEKNWFLQITQ